MTEPEDLALSSKNESSQEVQPVEQLVQQEVQQNQAISADWSSGFDGAEIVLDVLDVVGDLVKGIDLNI
ncbi:hypothetical protein [Acinetobacter terrestris]|uniref:hypothetical protein n=1 Tax=Acinetobacter terrestris TaxID=2529843 RepID=UPI00103D8E7F|nr:hypothetical protein [Acinetobacter terrestris]TCB57315.1 hypothetical protein E0H84_01495 [Acinetobacter terrestris]